MLRGRLRPCANAAATHALRVQKYIAVRWFLWDTNRHKTNKTSLNHTLTSAQAKGRASWPPRLSRTSCPVEATLSLISDKWKILILRDLLTGTKRFGELKKSIGSISQKVLTSNLRAMEDDGLLAREVFAEVPPRVEYTLTERGESLRPVIDAMRAWGDAHMEELAAEAEQKEAEEA